MVLILYTSPFQVTDNECSATKQPFKKHSRAVILILLCFLNLVSGESQKGRKKRGECTGRKESIMQKRGETPKRSGDTEMNALWETQVKKGAK